jgi:hypothetical protein
MTAKDDRAVEKMEAIPGNKKTDKPIIIKDIDNFPIVAGNYSYSQIQPKHRNLEPSTFEPLYPEALNLNRRINNGCSQA